MSSQLSSIVIVSLPAHDVGVLVLIMLERQNLEAGAR